MRILIISFGILFVISACKSRNSGGSSAGPESGIHEVIVEEAIQVPGYTYLRAKEGRNEVWLAVPTMDVKIGEKYYYSRGFLMTNFESRELKRTFENILFLENISSEPLKSATTTGMVSPGSSKSIQKKISGLVPPAEGSITIAQLYSEKKSYSGKRVSVTGQVTRFSPEIMGKNWIHLQDGTEFDGSFDLAITSDVSVGVGDTITFEGEITLDKDLGYGYFFDVLMENAIIR